MKIESVLFCYGGLVSLDNVCGTVYHSKCRGEASMGLRCCSNESLEINKANRHLQTKHSQYRVKKSKYYSWAVCFEKVKVSQSRVCVAFVNCVFWFVCPSQISRLNLFLFFLSFKINYWAGTGAWLHNYTPEFKKIPYCTASRPMQMTSAWWNRHRSSWTTEWRQNAPGWASGWMQIKRRSSLITYPWNIHLSKQWVNALVEVSDLYLGSWVTSSEQDLKVRKALAWRAQNVMTSVWKSSLPRHIKISFFQATIVCTTLWLWILDPEAHPPEVSGWMLQHWQHCLRCV